MKRQWNAYELNQLNLYGFDPEAKYPDQIPVEYITNRVEFFKRQFFVNESVLIPRPETEQIINMGLEFLLPQKKGILKHKSNKKKIIVADVGTGSGAIGITYGLELAKRNYDFTCYIIDINTNALDIAKKNIKELAPKNLRKNYIPLISNLLEQVSPNIRFDIIFANLPYIPSPRMKSLDESVKNFEPHIALDGGTDGAALIFKLIKQSQRSLKKDGMILLEVDDSHDAEFVEKHKELLRFWNVEILKDENQKIRFWRLFVKNN